jgi:hypothetical protein
MEIDKIKKPETEIHQIQEQKQEFKLLGSIRLIPGLTMFEFNWEKMTIEKLEVKKDEFINFDGSNAHKRKAQVKINCLYFQALNFKNAVKHANRIIEERTGIHKYLKLEKGKLLKKVIEDAHT